MNAICPKCDSGLLCGPRYRAEEHPYLGRQQYLVYTCDRCGYEQRHRCADDAEPVTTVADINRRVVS